ncbi:MULTISPECIES: multidrug efflux SMR transporter [Staphylococcus]|uniref:QacE family quaternary ammonium compound efflux SMR transporter n=1 Tax=Staphylococcus pettenkoferi TaxID=170573 RepID=A0A2N6QEN4_9STAP|nr:MULTISPECIES: multidrug efflux SMR transporter [Staphylococcus]MBX8993957.1 multidrug efflux SMR transporter [Staphylococcus pettenkoferi]MCI2791838.1 multidrug efflux SMR transporter [Staphylococcus pettenkoferi]MCY1568031.1 multidrug efflux SMR transporter [Staphylococcus pettenkoferi]MCY1588013.1 multidrug efflux SMR transporter [Staphylococcus pettenkoferi]MCY1604157.1 multidrug efflux SMR transporter [Staphylococcus pettenkoferi]
MAWIYLMIAGVFEIIGVVILNEINRTKKQSLIILLGLAFICSFLILKLAMYDIPMGTAYAIWTGIGTCGGAIIGMLFYNESRSAKRISFIALIIVAVIGLKLIN